MPRFGGIPVEQDTMATTQPATPPAKGPRFKGIPVDVPAAPASNDGGMSLTVVPGQTGQLIPTQTEGHAALARYGFGGPAEAGTPSIGGVKRDFRNADDLVSAIAQAKNAKDTGAADYFLSQLKSISARNADPTKGMTGAEKFAAGAGKAAVDTGRGLSQLGLQGANLLSGGQLDNAVAASKQNQDTTTARDAPLVGTAAGLAGNLAGYAALSAIPGSALRLIGRGAEALGATNAGRLSVMAGNELALPTGYGSAAGLGAAEGAAQPVGTEDSRWKNAAAGVVGGALGRAIPQGLGGLAGFVGRVAPAVTTGAQERRAATVIANLADNPDQVRSGLAGQIAQFVPGSRPTTAEATGDIGLAGLQRSLANVGDFNNALTQRYLDNNAARVGFVQNQFGGATNAAADAIRANRDRATLPLLNTAKQATGVDAAKVSSLADNLLDARKGNPAVQDVVNRVKTQLDNTDGSVAQLYNVRQYIDTLYKDGQDTAAKASRRELQVLKAALDSEMRKVSPEYGQYLNAYRSASREADRVDVGQRLLDASSNIQDSMGNPVLSPAKVGGFARDPDALVKQATGFKRASADATLTPGQAQAVQDLSQDLSRQAYTASAGKAIGSNTAQNLAGMNTAQDAIGALGSTIHGGMLTNMAMTGLNNVKRKYGEKVFAVVQDAMLNPERAAEVLSRLPEGPRRQILTEYGPALGIGVSQPLSREAFQP